MEENTFRHPAVAGVLAESFIEARLHADGDNHIERIRELQLELAQSVATPFYVAVDPGTGRSLATFAGFTADAGEFVSFLESGLGADAN